ncbi:MAG: deoxyribose-phosphate aldolase [bacterium]|nr:deoxyribose-phosphate aldolase [bacterium]
MAQVPATIARLIDHTLLKPTATPDEIIQLCQEAKQFGFATVCVNPTYVKLAKSQLQGSPVKVCTVVGFPLGATSTTAKVCETLQAIIDGADEIDMVINIGLLKGGRLKEVEEDIRAVKQACQGRILKVIIETALLSDEEKVTASILAKAAGADFVKTSTGFSSGGATVKDVALMRKAVGPEMGVKASGGIRDLATAEQMVQAGATRLGTSASIAIVKGTQ